MTPLLVASWKGNLEILKALLAIKGIDVNAPNDYGVTPLLAAVNNGHLEIVQLLLAKKEIKANLANNDCETPLLIASWKGNLEILKALLAIKGIDVNAANNDGRTPLSVASLGYNKEAAQLIIQHILAHDHKADKPDFLKGELSGYWDNQVKKEIFLLNNKCIFDNMSKYSKYVIDRCASLDDLISDAKNFLKETQEKSDVVIDFAGLIEYGVDVIYLGPLAALAFGKYEKEVSRMLGDPNAERSEVGPVFASLTTSTTQQSAKDDETVSSCFSCIRVKEHGKCVIL